MRAVVGIAADHNMITTAEGVETLAQRGPCGIWDARRCRALFSAARPASEIRGLLGSGAAGAEAAA